MAKKKKASGAAAHTAPPPAPTVSRTVGRLELFKKFFKKYPENPGCVMRFASRAERRAEARAAAKKNWNSTHPAQPKHITIPFMSYMDKQYTRKVTRLHKKRDPFLFSSMGMRKPFSWADSLTKAQRAAA